MQDENFVFDELHLLSGETKKGIIDFSTTKHLMFYDLTNNTDPDISLIAIIWRMYHDDKRFSIFKALYFNNNDFPQPVLINKKMLRGFRTSALPPKTPKRPTRTITVEVR